MICGGTRVPRVVSGVAPETDGGHRLWVLVPIVSHSPFTVAIRRDAELNPPEAGATD